MALPPKFEYLIENPSPSDYSCFVYGTDTCMLRVVASTDGDLEVHSIPDAPCSFTLKFTEGYSRGIHVWQVFWPFLQRGKHALVGIVTNEKQPDPITGFTTESWAWNLNKNKLYNDAFNKPSKNYPLDVDKDQYLDVPNMFFMVFDIDSGILGFIANNTYLGDAFKIDCKNKEFFFQMSLISFRYTDMSVRHWHMDNRTPLPLLATCRIMLRQKLDREKMAELLKDEHMLPKNIREYLSYKERLPDERYGFFKTRRY